MLNLKTYKKKVYFKFFIFLSIFILTILGFILLKNAENNIDVYDFTLGNNRENDKVFIRTSDVPINFYLYEKVGDNSHIKVNYYFVEKDDVYYVFEARDDTFEEFLSDGYENNHFKYDEDDEIIITGYLNEINEKVKDELIRYLYENMDYSGENIHINGYFIKASGRISPNFSNIYDFLQMILVFIGVPLFFSFSDLKKYNENVNKFNVRALEKELDNGLILESELPFLLTDSYFVILDESSWNQFVGVNVIKLGQRNYQMIGNSFVIIKYNDIKHMIIEEGRNGINREYYILYIVDKNNNCFTYRTRSNIKREMLNNVQNYCLEKNSNILIDPENREYAGTFIKKYFKRGGYIVLLLFIFFLYCAFVTTFITMLFS